MYFNCLLLIGELILELLGLGPKHSQVLTG